MSNSPAGAGASGAHPSVARFTPRSPRRIGVRHGFAEVLAVGIVTLIAGGAGAACASAFFVREQSAAALGSAFAGATAGADDVTYMFYNAASLTRQQGSGLAGVGTIISSAAKFRDGSGETLAETPIHGGEGGRNGGGLSGVPAMYGLWDLGETFADAAGVKLGIAINVPFGFETEYEDGWIGRYYALQSRVRSIDVNPVVAWEAMPGVSLAVGLQAQYLDAKLSNAVDFGSIGAANGVPTAVPGEQDGFAKMVGDDVGFGWTAGVLLEPWPSTRFGFSWRSAVSHDIRGDGRVTLDAAGTGVALGLHGGTTGAEANLTTPDVAAVGVYHEIDEAWAVMADVTWTRWSRFRTLRVQFEDASSPDDLTEEDWRDTWFVAAGCKWRSAPDWVLRSGVAYDQSPARNRTRTPRTPIKNGVLLAAGATWEPAPPLSVSFGYSHTFIESARIDLRGGDPGNASRGDLSGSSDNAVDVFSMQFIWRF